MFLFDCLYHPLSQRANIDRHCQLLIIFLRTIHQKVTYKHRTHLYTSCTTLRETWAKLHLPPDLQKSANHNFTQLELEAVLVQNQCQ